MLVWPSHPKTLFYLCLRFWTQNSAHSTVHCEFKIHQPWYLSLLRGHSSHWWFLTCLELSKFLARDSQHTAHLHQGFRVPLCLPVRSPRPQQKCTANPSKVPVQLKENHLFCQFSERLTVHVHKHLCKPSAGGNAVTRITAWGQETELLPVRVPWAPNRKEPQPGVKQALPSGLRAPGILLHTTARMQHLYRSLSERLNFHQKSWLLDTFTCWFVVDYTV